MRLPPAAHADEWTSCATRRLSGFEPVEAPSGISEFYPNGIRRGAAAKQAGRRLPQSRSVWPARDRPEGLRRLDAPAQILRGNYERFCEKTGRKAEKARLLEVPRTSDDLLVNSAHQVVAQEALHEPTDMVRPLVNFEHGETEDLGQQDRPRLFGAS